MALTEEAREYLLKRGYSLSLIAEESPESISPGKYKRGNIEIFIDRESILLPVQSLSGRIIAYHAASIKEKDYRTFYDLNHHYLPMSYGCKTDWEIMWKSKQVIIAEGLFDRVALKRAFPERAVLARLTKGVSPPLIRLFNRLCERVWLAFDNDAPGVKSALKAEGRLKSDVVILEIPYKDPSRFLEVRGVDAVRKHYQRQITAFDM